MIKSLFKQSSFYFIGLSSAKILSVFVFILFARALHPSVFGDLVLYATLGQIATTLGDFGLNQWYQKQAHIEDHRKLFSKLINARAISLIVSLIIAFIFFKFVPTFSKEIIYLFLLTMIPDAFISCLDGYYFHKKQSIKVALKRISYMMIFLVGYLLYQNGLTLDRSVQIYFFATIITLFWIFPWAELKNFMIIRLKEIKNTLKSSFSYASLTLTSFAYAKGDSLVVRYALNSQALGIYGAAYRFLEGLALLPTALQHNLFSLSAKESNVNLNQVKKMTSVMTIFGITIGFLLFIFSGTLIPLILGVNYLSAIPVVKVFSVVVILFFISSPLNTIVLSSRLVTKFLPYGIGNTVLNLLLNILIVPIYGIVGAAWVMFTTELTGLFINIWFVKKVYEN